MSIPLSAQAPPRRARPRLRRRRAARPLAVAEADPVEVPLQRARLGALRGDLPAAVVPDHARGGAPARAVRGRDGRAARGSDHDRRARLRQRREARDARRAPAQPPPARARPPDRHLARGARALGAHARRARARLGRRPPRDVRGGSAPRGVAEARRRHDAGALPRLQHRQLRPSRRRRVPPADPRQPAARGRAAARRPTS